MDSKSSDLPKSTENDVKPQTSPFDFERFKQRVRQLEDNMNKMKSRMTKPKEQKKRDDKKRAEPTEVKRDLNTPGTSGMKGDSSRTPPRSTAKPTLSDQTMHIYRQRLAQCVDILIQEQLEHFLILGSDLDIDYYARRLVEFKKLVAAEESRRKQHAHGQAVPREVDDEIAKEGNTKIEQKKNELLTQENKTDNSSSSESEQTRKCVEEEVDELIRQLNEIELGPEIARILMLGSQFDLEPYEKRLIEMKKMCAEHSSKVKQCAHRLHSPEAVATELKLDDATTGTTKQESIKIKDTAIATPKDIPTDHSPKTSFHRSVRKKKEKKIRLKH